MPTIAGLTLREHTITLCDENVPDSEGAAYERPDRVIAACRRDGRWDQGIPVASVEELK